MSSLPFDALAEVVVTSFVILAVSLRDISVQVPSTAGAFQNAGKNMCVVWVTDLFTPPCGTLTLGLCKIPVVLRNDGFMLTDIDGKLRLLHNVHFVSSAEFLFNLAATKCNLTAVNGIVQNTSNKYSRKLWDSSILTELFHIAMGVQIPGNTCYTIVGMDKAVKNNTDNFHFIVCNRKLAIFQPIAIGCKAAVPFALTGFLFTAGHRLSTDILTFDFSNSRKNRNH